MTTSLTLEQLAAGIARLSDTVPAELENLTTNLAMMGVARVKLNASGRPGPRRVTGDYTRTINVQFSRSASGIEASIGTNAVQALRLEYGFRGTDSLGRRYNQPPYRHFAPAYEWLAVMSEQRVPAAMDRGIRRALGA